MFDQSELETQGWVSVPVSPQIDFIEFVRCLGDPVRSRRDGSVVDRLVPKENNGRPSLSQTYGLGRFPFHTDMAYARRPPRYVCLLSREPNSVSTLLLDTANWQLSSAEQTLLQNEVWSVDNGRIRFLTSVLRPSILKTGYTIRYDSACMRPALSGGGRGAEALLIDLIKSGTFRCIVWNRARLVIIDNWRMLHGRDAIPSSYTTRCIERISISAPPPEH